MARRQIMFFATKKDISIVLSALESSVALQYTQRSLSENDAPPSYQSYEDIPSFGKTCHPAAVVSPHYILSPFGARIRIRPVPQYSGGTLFAVDQLENPDTIALRPGGRYGSNVILYGTLGTVSESSVSREMYTFAAKLFRKSFSRQEEFLVGPEAEGLWRSGFRLTTGAESPTDFDLKPPIHLP